MADTQTNTAALERTKELTDRLEAGIQDLLQSDKYMEYLKSMSQFHRYSTRNTLLIHMQNPNATRVASYKLWDEQFNRHVKKGEKSIRIFAPISPPPEKKMMEKLDPATGAPVLDSDGKPVMEEMTALSRPRFKLVPVFDVSQTYGDPLPELVENLTGDVEQYGAFLDTLREVSPLPVEFEPLPENNDGYCRYGEKIGIREGMSEVQTVSAVVHEITHARLHDTEKMTEQPENTEEKSKRMREVEAESVSYVVCQHFGIETSPNSFGYLAEWGSEDMSEFKASLDVIRKESNALITAIDERFKAICKERGIVLSAKKPEQATPEAPTAEPPAEPSFTTETHTENIAGVDFTATDIIPGQPEEAFEITYWQMGIGTLALHYFNEGHERYGDFEELASIAPDRSVTFRQADLSDEIKEKINAYALTAEIPNMAADISNEPKNQDNLSAEDYHLGFGPNENGVEVWNWNETEAKDGSPKFLAAIDNNRDVTYLDDNLPDNIKADIENIAHGDWKEMFATEMAGMDYDPPPFTASESPEILPDPSITAAERNSYGYTFDDMLPLRKETALALFAADHTIYMLYDDDTEATAFDSDEIMTFAEMNNGIFGISKGDWENSPEHAELAAQNSEAVEQPNHIHGGMDSFDIYQLKSGDELHYHRFASLNQLKADNLTVDKDNYNRVYAAPLLPTDTLDEIYRQFNHAHPHDYTGRSISVSDVIVIQRDGEITAHYVDNDSFVELPAFLGNEQQAEVTAPHEQEKPMAEPVIQTKLSTMLGLNLEDGKAPPPIDEPTVIPQSVYRESIPYAREHDELDKYRDDVRLNTDCRDAIHTAIDESRYDTHFYKMKDAAKHVIDTYGAERVELIMAKIVQGADWDGRYSRQNKEWAKGFEIPQSMKDIYSNTHPILLDGFLDRVREKPSVLETLKANAEKSRQQSEPKQDSKKSKEMEM